MVKKAWPPGKDLKYTAAGWGRVDGASNEVSMSNVLVAMNSTLESKKYCETTLTRRVGRLEESRVSRNIGTQWNAMEPYMTNLCSEFRIKNQIFFPIRYVLEALDPGKGNAPVIPEVNQ